MSELPDKKAYLAMYAFLESYFERTGSEDVRAISCRRLILRCAEISAVLLGFAPLIVGGSGTGHGAIGIGASRDVWPRLDHGHWSAERTRLARTGFLSMYRTTV